MFHMSYKHLARVLLVSLLFILLSNEAIVYFVSKKSLDDNLVESMSEQVDISATHDENVGYLSDDQVSIVQYKISASIRNDLIVVGAGASILVVAVTIHVFNRIKSKNEQDNYIEEFNALFVEVKGLRHDFNNHLDTLHGLIELERFDEAKRYINDLAEETVQIHEILDIGHPGIAALIQSKLTQSVACRIDLIWDFHNLASGMQKGKGVKTVDIVKILGNLLDNAFDEVMKLTESERKVYIKGEVLGNELRFIVKNKLHRKLFPDAVDQMLRPKHSSKNSTGIGLSIVKERVARYKGGIRAEFPEDGYIQFNVWLPINN